MVSSDRDRHLHSLEILSGSSRSRYADWDHIRGSYLIAVAIEYQLQGTGTRLDPI